MLELLMGFWIGRATKGANPFVVVASFIIALAMLALMAGSWVAIWHFSPQAVQVVQWSGIARYVPFLDLRLHEVGVQGPWAISMELPSRLALCSVAMLVIGFIFMAAVMLLNITTTVVVQAVKRLSNRAHA
ncbi:hypothetical protein HHL24_26700 [Paraburkholderia sp. RP-4-7]|jgi:hypothetical protein|uniref:Uncharacterized protein n=1 Tax=Paraburkholderia polaris TaxID=2728848 RepID=A0A848IP10_9BURK|nr:hypothetical protein [Paraburkholderia polaris]NMM01514.1 hypothetical protein [Paraburkholderia polaris]